MSITDYIKQLYAKKLDNLEGTDKLLETYCTNYQDLIIKKQKILIDQ